MRRIRFAVIVTVMMPVAAAWAYTSPSCPAPWLFGDVGQADPTCPWLFDARQAEIMDVCAFGKLCPDNPVTRSQVSKYILKALHEHLWGEGRPNAAAYGFFSGVEGAEVPCSTVSGAWTVYFKLSEMVVPWYSAPAACPAGTWVCTAAERGSIACDTLRPDTTGPSACDYLDCGLVCKDALADAHPGWLSEATSDFQILSAQFQTEAGTAPATDYTCELLPVWCCSHAANAFPPN